MKYTDPTHEMPIEKGNKSPDEPLKKKKSPLSGKDFFAIEKREKERGKEKNTRKKAFSSCPKSPDTKGIKIS